jgi:hypothetical protein
MVGDARESRGRERLYSSLFLLGIIALDAFVVYLSVQFVQQWVAHFT